MYKFLVAEDSKVILRDIVRLIKEAGYDSFIKTAYDGETALEILKDYEPDIIITDIKMPVIDGLTLIQKAKAMYAGVKCVIISGYADFTFTHEALMLQVDDYVMKPVDTAEFRDILKKLTKEADRNKVQKEEEVLQKIIQEGILVNDGRLPEQYVAALIRVGLFQQYSAPLSKELVSGIMEQNCAVSAFRIVNTKLNSEKIVIFDPEQISAEHITQQAGLLLAELRKKYTRVNIICSAKLKDIGSLNTQYTRLSNHLGRLVMLDAGMVYKDDGNPEERGAYIRQKEEIEVFRKKMERILKNRAVHDYRKEIHKSILYWEEKQYTVVVLRKFLQTLLDEIFIAAGGSLGLAEEPGTLADKMLNDCRKYEELEECLQGYADFLSAGKEERNGVSIEIACKLTEYMQTNLYKNLSLQEIADYFEISPSYICRIFKVYYNDTPISYYNRIKIEEARKMLDEYQNMRVKDIAEMLGFSDQYYFSKVFKQQFGVSPLVYKTQVKKDEN